LTCDGGAIRVRRGFKTSRRHAVRVFGLEPGYEFSIEKAPVQQHAMELYLPNFAGILRGEPVNL
jgi:hypothetical protein